MKVFISYGDVADQVMALRLQALGAVNGLTVYVPPAYTRHVPGYVPISLDSEAIQKLREAEVVLGVVGAGLTEACRLELNTAISLHKQMIVMSSPMFEPQFQPLIGSNLVVIDPADPGAAEIGIMGHLKNISAQNAKKALFALGTLAVGLFMLASADRD